MYDFFILTDGETSALDLGVTVSVDMKWERQCIEAVKKANKMLGLIKRNFGDKSKYSHATIQESS